MLILNMNLLNISAFLVVWSMVTQIITSLCINLFRLNLASLEWKSLTAVNFTNSGSFWIQYYNENIFISMCQNNELLIYNYSMINNETKLIENSPCVESRTLLFGFNNFWYGYDDGLEILYGADFSLAEFSIKVIGIYNFTIFEASIASFGNNLAVFGGYTTTNLNTLTIMHIEDNCTLVNIFNIAESISPSPRLSHTIVQINYKLFMFGGYEQSNYYGDLWAYDTIKHEWIFMSTTGSSPTPRAYHASASSGDALLIWGGEDYSGLLNDFFIYNSLTSNWMEIIPSSNTIPSNRKGACMMTNVPFIYIFGGETPFESSNELWQYSFLTNLYSIVSYYDTQLAYANCQIFSSDSILIYCGYIVKNYIFNNAIIYIFSKNQWSTYPLNNINCGIQGISIYLEGTFVNYGGRNYRYDGSYELFIITDKEIYAEIEPLAPFCMGFAYIQSNLYFFSGGINTLSGDINLQLGKETFAYVDIKALSKKYNFKLTCSPGSYLLNNECILCPPGTYAENYGSTYCTVCGPGKANPQIGSTSQRQCYPCGAGFFNEKYGATTCLTCPAGYDCPVGTYSLQNTTYISTRSSIQPLNYSPPNYSDLIKNFQRYFSM